MSGGGRKKDRAREDAMYRQTTALQQEVRKPSAFDQWAEQRFLAQRDWESQDGRDIRDMPGMEEHVQIADAALAKSNNRRIGQGALDMAGGGGSEYASKIREFQNKNLAQETAASLEAARYNTRAENLNYGQYASEMGMKRIGTALGSSQGMFEKLYQPKRGFWDYAMGVGNMAIQGARAGAGMFAGGA